MMAPAKPAVIHILGGAGMDRIELDRRALAWSLVVVDAVTPADLGDPTPCGPWTLGDLIGHMIAHNRGFAAGLRSAPVGAEVWDGLALPERFHDAYATSAAELTAAFESPERPEEIDVFGFGVKPMRSVLGMHIVDYVVHGWDVARSIGSPLEPDEDLAAAAFEIMGEFPGKRPNKAFGLVVPVPDDAPSIDRLVGLVGRNPQWTPTTPS
jgi:uncharacterized protein (TIGR03086 family)